MSKTEMVTRSAQEQAVPMQERARSTAEAQSRLIDRLDQLAVDQMRLAEEQRTGARQLAASMKGMAQKAGQVIEKAQKETESTLGRATATLVRTEESLQETQKAAKSAAMQAVKASKNIQEQATRLRWTTIATAAACGLLTGMVSLIALLIWQPELIRTLWKIAQAIR